MTDRRAFSVDQVLSACRKAFPAKNGFPGSVRIDDRAPGRASGRLKSTKVQRINVEVAFPEHVTTQEVATTRPLRPHMHDE
jgi:hypothetical protein